MEHWSNKALKLDIAPQHSLIALLNETRLNVVSWKTKDNGVVKCKVLLVWLEPFVWALQQLRWSVQPTQEDSSVIMRSKTCSWLELGIMVFLISEGQAFPPDVSFAGCAAITRNLWVAASKFLRLVDEQSKFHLFKKSIKELPKAGAAITCGVKSLQGLSRRPVTDDHPNLAMLTAICLKLAAEDAQKLDLRIPHLKLAGLVWNPSGLFSTAEAIRNRQELKLDAAPLRPKTRGRGLVCLGVYRKLHSARTGPFNGELYQILRRGTASRQERRCAKNTTRGHALELPNGADRVGHSHRATFL